MTISVIIGIEILFLMLTAKSSKYTEVYYITICDKILYIFLHYFVVFRRCRKKHGDGSSAQKAKTKAIPSEIIIRSPSQGLLSQRFQMEQLLLFA